MSAQFCQTEQADQDVGQSVALAKQEAANATSKSGKTMVGQG
jgi:hypothetical protein